MTTQQIYTIVIIIASIIILYHAILNFKKAMKLRRLRLQKNKSGAYIQ